MPKISFVALGCRLNQAEEEKLRRQFLEAGAIICDPEMANIIILNTCSVTALADKKSRQMIRRLIAQNPKAKTVVMGCAVGATKGIIGIDLTIPNEDKSRAFEIINSKIGKLELTLNSKLITKNSNARTRALLKVQDGCNNFCSYCIIPYLRGREVSLPLNSLINEAKELDQLGYRELVISGVNVGRYQAKGPKNNGQEEANLAGLLTEILENTNFPRIRLSSINPQDITDDLIELWRTEPRLCRHFHLSLQSGSDSVLKRMGRPYDTKAYLEVVNKIRRAVPGVAITTDLIVGFPGETDGEFKETCDYVRKIRLSKLHVFPYSIRKGTRAAERKDQLDSQIKKARAAKLRSIGKRLREEHIGSFIGDSLPVLFEEKKGKYWYGLTDNYIRIKYQSDENLENQIREVVVTEMSLNN